MARPDRYPSLIGSDRDIACAVAAPPDDDSAIAIAIDDASAESVDESPRSSGAVVSDDPAGTIERILQTLEGGTPGALKEALRVLTEAYAAFGSGLGEWSGRGEPSIMAFCGPVAKTSNQLEICRFFSDASRRRDKEPFCSTTIIEKDLRYLCVALSRPGYQLLTLVVWGDVYTRFDDVTLVRVFLRLVDRLREPKRALAAAVEERPRFEDAEFPAGHLRCRSDAMLETYRHMRLVARADFPLLVIGETGAGKEHVVQILHEWSKRRGGPFVAVNCAAIPDTLLEAEMFGIGRGVASGVHEREGKFQLAEGGTLFLDEIGELPLPLQAKLLRVLQDNQVTPVGARSVAVDVRVIAATNADLEEKMRKGLFRSDLYYRIAGSVVRVPPLRERRRDIGVLVEHFLRKCAAETGRPIRGLSVRALELLTEYTWPGNVRELEHEVRRLVYTCPPGQVIDSSRLSESITSPDPSPTQPPSPDAPLDLATRVADLERTLIQQALTRAHGNRSVAARMLGLSRNGLALKMARLGVE